MRSENMAKIALNAVRLPKFIFILFFIYYNVHQQPNNRIQSYSAFNCLSSGINILAVGRPLPPEILPPSDLPSPVNGILWEMSELITQERIDVGSSNLVDGLTT